jgi:ABC-type antimicrobial peptide transport system permease subunit
MIVYGEALQRTSRSADSKNANRQRGATDFGSCATPSSRGHHPALSDGRANTSNPTALAASIRETIQQADSRLPLFGAKTLNEQIDETLVQERIVALLSSLFGIVALLLACVGLYGVMSSLVVQRTHEIGIRMALGAERFRVLRLVLGRGMAIALIGVIAGMAGAVGGTRFMVACFLV